MIPSPYQNALAPAPATLMPKKRSAYQELDRPFHSAPVKTPKNDPEAIDLVQQTKAAYDHQASQVDNTTHPAVAAQYMKARQDHINHAAKAINDFYEQKKTPLGKQLVDAIYSDPAIKIAHPKPKT